MLIIALLLYLYLYLYEYVQWPTSGILWTGARGCLSLSSYPNWDWRLFLNASALLALASLSWFQSPIVLGKNEFL